MIVQVQQLTKSCQFISPLFPGASYFLHQSFFFQIHQSNEEAIRTMLMTNQEIVAQLLPQLTTALSSIQGQIIRPQQLQQMAQQQMMGQQHTVPQQVR